MKSWSDRESVTSAEEATEAIADFLSSSDGIWAARNDKLDDVEQFACKWDIPFDRQLISKMIHFQNEKRWKGDGALITKTEEELYEEFLKKEEENIKVDRERDDWDEECLQDWFEDWKYENYGSSHTWMSSSDMC